MFPHAKIITFNYRSYGRSEGIASEKNLFKDGILPDTIDNKILECWGDFEILFEHTDDLGGLNFLEIRSTLPDELLLYADKISMNHGLELRVPYLDKEIVEFAHTNGLKVNVWTVNDSDTMRNLIQLGVDGIITDDISLALKTISSENYTNN